MREILFRAWWKDGGGLVDQNAYVIRQNGTIEFPEGGWDLWGSDDSHLVVLEQFTGLTDKNGVKIFDGDILQGDDDIEDDVFHVARIGQSDENRYECFLDFNGDNKCWIPFIKYFNRMEVIGNIHEGVTRCTSAIVE